MVVNEKLTAARAALALLVALILGVMPGCNLGSAPEPPAPVPRTVFIPDVSLSAAGSTFTSICLDAFRRVLDHSATNRGTVSVEVIDGAPRTNSRTPVDLRFTVAEQFEGNPVYERPILNGQKATAMEQIEGILSSGPTTRGSDVIGAIALAERIFQRPALGSEPERKSLVICSDGFNTTAPINFYRLTPSLEDTEQLISQLRDEGRLPVELAGVHVYLVGAGQPTGGRVSADQARAVETFFRSYFKAVDAEVVMVGATLPSFP